MRKNIALLAVCLLCFVSMFAAFDVKSFAASNTISDVYVPYAQPYAGSNGGYVNFLRRLDNGQYGIITYFWYQTGSNCFVDVAYLGNNQVRFWPHSGSDGFLFIGYYSTDGTFRFLDKRANDQPITDPFAGTVLGWEGYGNIGSFSSVLSDPVSFTVHYQDNDVDYMLQRLYLSVYANTSLQDDIYNKLIEIANDGFSSLNILTSTYNYIADALPTIKGDVQSIKAALNSVNAYLIRIDTTTSSIDATTKQILQALQSSQADNDKMHDFADKSASQKDDINQAVADSGNFDKPSGDTIAPDVDSLVDADGMATYNGVLSKITGWQLTTSALLTVFGVALVSYVLFGKR